MCCGTFADCAKNCLCCFNFTNAVSGLVLVILAVWAKSDDTIGEMINLIPALGSFLGMVIALGVIIFIISALGCVGALMRHKYILMAYFVVLAIITLTKFVIAMVLLAKASKDVSPDVIEMLQEQFDKNRESYIALEFLLKCCGVTGVQSYLKVGQHASLACCDIGLDSIPGRCTAKKAKPGCESKVWPYLRTAYKILVGFLLLLVFLEGILLVLTFLVIWAIHKDTLTRPIVSRRPDNIDSVSVDGTKTPTAVNTVQTPQGQGLGTANTVQKPQGQGVGTANTVQTPQGQGLGTVDTPNRPKTPNKEKK